MGDELSVLKVIFTEFYDWVAVVFSDPIALRRAHAVMPTRPTLAGARFVTAPAVDCAG